MEEEYSTLPGLVPTLPQLTVVNFVSVAGESTLENVILSLAKVLVLYFPMSLKSNSAIAARVLYTASAAAAMTSIDLPGEGAVTERY